MVLQVGSSTRFVTKKDGMNGKKTTLIIGVANKADVMSVSTL